MLVNFFCLGKYFVLRFSIFISARILISKTNSRLWNVIEKDTASLASEEKMCGIWASMSTFPACPPSQHVHLPSMSTFPARPPSQHVHLPSMSTFPACLPSQHIHLPSMSTFPACPPSQHVHLPSTSTFPACPPSQHVHLPSTSTFPACPPSQHVHLPSTSTFRACLPSQHIHFPSMSTFPAHPPSQHIHLPSMSAFPACPPSQHVHLPSTSTFPACPPSQHVHLPSMSTFPAHPPSQHVHLPSTSTFPACPPSQHIHLPSTSTFPARPLSQHVHLPSMQTTLQGGFQPHSGLDFQVVMSANFLSKSSRVFSGCSGFLPFHTRWLFQWINKLKINAVSALSTLTAELAVPSNKIWMNWHVACSSHTLQHCGVTTHIVDGLQHSELTAKHLTLLVLKKHYCFCWLLASYTRNMQVYLRQFYMLPHSDKSCKSKFLSHPVIVFWQHTNQSQCWPNNDWRLGY